MLLSRLYQTRDLGFTWSLQQLDELRQAMRHVQVQCHDGIIMKVLHQQPNDKTLCGRVRYV